MCRTAYTEAFLWITSKTLIRAFRIKTYMYTIIIIRIIDFVRSRHFQLSARTIILERSVALSYPKDLRQCKIKSGRRIKACRWKLDNLSLWRYTSGFIVHSLIFFFKSLKKYKQLNTN